MPLTVITPIIKVYLLCYENDVKILITRENGFLDNRLILKG